MNQWRKKNNFHLKQSYSLRSILLPSINTRNDSLFYPSKINEILIVDSTFVNSLHSIQSSLSHEFVGWIRWQRGYKCLYLDAGLPCIHTRWTWRIELSKNEYRAPCREMARGAAFRLLHRRNQPLLAKPIKVYWTWWVGARKRGREISKGNEREPSSGRGRVRGKSESLSDKIK